MTLGFPGKARILSYKVQNQLASIRMVPDGDNGDVDPKKMEFDIAEVIMEYKNGIWKMKNVNKLPLDAWCLKASTEMPPSIPCQASIGGKILGHLGDTVRQQLHLRTNFSKQRI
ncbi:MAG: hypothetical protein R3C24_10360 [Cyanobacteriota/Melainabacteria group bacterium]